MNGTLLRHVSITLFHGKGKMDFHVTIHKTMLDVNGNVLYMKVANYWKVTGESRNRLTLLAWGANVTDKNFHFSGDFPSAWFDLNKEVRNG